MELPSAGDIEVDESVSGWPGMPCVMIEADAGGAGSGEELTGILGSFVGAACCRLIGASSEDSCLHVWWPSLYIRVRTLDVLGIFAVRAPEGL